LAADLENIHYIAQDLDQSRGIPVTLHVQGHDKL
jgi:hypothetical protein